MRSTAWLSTVCALALGGAAHVGAGLAAAQECASDDDCADGLICKSYGSESCARPAIDCVDGQECPEPEPCEPREVKACALPPCETDDDCPSDTVCHAFTYERCSEGGGAGFAPPSDCPPEADCPQPEEPACDDPECKEAGEVVCEPITAEPACVPVWQLPCTQSADCGPGFTCEEEVIGWCSGSAGSPTPRDEADPLPPEQPEPEPAPEPECGEEPTGRFYCKPVVTECSTDGDCAAGWSCGDNPERPVCDSAERPASDGDSGGSGDFAPPPEDEPVDRCGESTAPAMVCMPPYYAASDAAGRGVATGGLADNESGGEPPTSSGEGDDDGADGEEGEGDETGSDGAAAEDSGGCTVSVGAGARGSAVTLLGLLGVCALLRRRARRA